MVNGDDGINDPDSTELATTPSGRDEPESLSQRLGPLILDRQATVIPVVEAVTAMNQQLVTSGVVEAMAAMNRQLVTSGFVKAMAAMNRQLATSGFVKAITAVNQQFATSGVVQAVIALNRQSALSVSSSLSTMEVVRKQLTLAYPPSVPKPSPIFNVRPDSSFDKRFGPDDNLSPNEEQQLLYLFDQMVEHDGLRKYCRGLFADGYYALAVARAYIFVDKNVQTKSGLANKYGADLMRAAFSEKSPVLKFNTLQSISERNEQLGYMEIFAGTMTGIRNPLAHEYELVDDPKTALDQLVMANHLMKMLENVTKD